VPATLLCLLAQTICIGLVEASPRQNFERVEIMVMVRLTGEERVSGIPSCLEAFEPMTE
jgi:hypothetical protein